MNTSFTKAVLLGGALAAAWMFSSPALVLGYSLIGGSLGIGTTGNGFQRDFRIRNNAADPAANNNTTPEADHPGALGAALAVWKAGQAWNSTTVDAARNFDFDWQGATASTANNENIVLWADSGCSAGVLAYTMTPISDGWMMVICESAWVWSDGPGDPGSGEIDIQGVVAHELGHALGLGHTSVGCSGGCATQPTMCPYLCGTGVLMRDIEGDDQAGLQAVYGTIPANKPVISSLSGSTATGGTLTIHGSNFAGTVNVKFTADAAQNTGTITGVVYNVTSVSGTQIDVVIPAAALDGEVHVWEPSLSRLSNGYPIDINAAPPAPSITSLAPGSAQAIGGEVITLTGASFTGAASVQVGTVTLLPPLGFTIVNDATITFKAPPATALGAASVTVTNATGTSNALPLNYVVTSPAEIIAPPQLANGAPATWSWGDDPGDAVLLLVNLDGATGVHSGMTILTALLALPFPDLDAAGLGGFTATPSGVPVGTTFYTQVLTHTGTLATLEASDIDLTNVVP
ncbi:MAG: IPT/TIG domain-containing protein [Planctomycetes bacterium]|nr:IPT/TIG domain-containing protein [Planctomycetota bacterium]